MAAPATGSEILPLTVVAAVSLFVLKELLEAVRRWRADGRKKKALRRLLARECELNLWTIKKVHQALTEAKQALKRAKGEEFLIIRPHAGVERIRHLDINGDTIGESPFPPVHITIMSDVELDVAELDKSLFAALEEAQEAAAELNHVRSSLVNYIENPAPFAGHFFQDFTEYGLRELFDIFKGFDRLNRACTGKRLASHRLR